MTEINSNGRFPGSYFCSGHQSVTIGPGYDPGGFGAEHINKKKLPTMQHMPLKCARVDQLLTLGIVILPLLGKTYWVYDLRLLNHGSLGPNKCIIYQVYTPCLKRKPSQSNHPLFASPPTSFPSKAPPNKRHLDQVDNKLVLF